MRLEESNTTQRDKFMIKVKTRGNFVNTERFLNRATRMDIYRILMRFGEEGVAALSAATPIDSGETASMWRYEVVREGRNWKVYWSNDNVNNGVPIAIILQYGHGTRNGGWVQGRDYINPAILPILDKLADEAWREVSRE